VTLSRAGTDTFFPAATTSITLAGGKFVRLMPYGTNWFNVGSN
jgi:hypothetical protein